MFHAVRKAALAGLALLLVAGCGKKSDDAKIVATAGDVKVTLADYYDAYNKITQQNRPDISTLEAKRRFANDLINKEILVAEAMRMGGITDSTTLAKLNEAFESRLLTILYREEVEAKTTVDAKDVTELYEKRQVGVDASHILLEDPATAAKVREEIASGKISFENAAEKYSLDQSTKRKGGALGVLLWGRSSPAFQQLAFELEPGTISQPLETEFGTHLIRVNARVPQTVGSREDMAQVLRTEARRQKEQLRLREFTAEVLTKANIQWNDSGMELVRQLSNAFVTQDIDTIPMEQQYIPAATEEQMAIPLATYSGGTTITIGDYIAHLRMQPYTSRPSTSLPMRGFQELIKTAMIQPKVLVQEAYARKLDERPEAKGEDERIREQVLIEMVHSRFIQEADVTEEEARAVYDSTLAANPEAMRIPERVDMKVFVSMSEDAIRQGLARMRAGESEDAVLRELSEDMRSKFNAGSTGLIARGNYAPKLEDVAFSRKAGSGWSSPIATETGFGAVKVIAFEPSRIATFDDMKMGITQQLMFARGERAFEEWLTKHRESLNVVIHDDVLEMMGQPVSGAAPGTPAGTPPPAALGGAPPAAGGEPPAAPPASTGGK